MRYSKFIKKIGSIALSCALVFALVTIVAPSKFDVAALSSSELKDKIAQYEQKEKEIQGKIDALEDDKDAAQEKYEQLQSQVNVIEEKISLINSRIDALESEIQEKQTEINEKEAEIKKAKDLLKQRLKAIYIAGASSEILVLLSADDYSDFLLKSDVMRCITTDTKQLMQKLEKQIKQINAAKKIVEANKAEADSLKQDLVSQQDELDAKYAESKKAYDDVVATQDELKDESAEIKKAREKDEAAFEAALKREQSNSPSVGNVQISGSFGFVWPYGGSYYISSGYGWRWGKLHGGVDITGSGAYGKPIYATYSGRVIVAESYYTYGNCVMIDHGYINGNSYASLYGHCSSLVVSNGQSVSKGQLIAYVGSTGHSTGPHLHFEIRVNGDRVDPLGYFQNY